MPRNLNIYLDHLLWFPSGANDFVMRWPVEEPDIDKHQGLEWRQSLKDAVFRADSSDPHTPIPVTIEDEAFAICNFKTGTNNGSEEKKKPKLKARILLTPASKQRQIVASIRLSGTDKTEPHRDKPPLEEKYNFRVSIERKNDKGVDNRLPRNKSNFVFSPDAVSDVVLKELGLIEDLQSDLKLGFIDLLTATNTSSPPKLDEDPSGLIIVAGGTGTGKSTYARGIILRYLLRLAMKQIAEKQDKNELHKYEPPHLVSYEDPIEAWSLAYDGAKVDEDTLDLLESPESDLKAGIRLSCRAKKYDVDTLNSACLHALRQKPKIVYIGECRESKDWNLALELGGTGHLVVTTCHSASLVDTFVKVAGTDTRDAQSRQRLASSLLGVLHLKSGTFRKKDPSSPEKTGPFTNFKEKQTFFSLWKKTPESVSNFVVDGLASIIIDDDNVLSRRRMTELTLKVQAADDGEIFEGNTEFNDRNNYFDKLSKVAMEMAFRLDMERN